MNGIYKIKFFKSAEKLTNHYNSLSESERENISELDAESFFDYENKNKNYTCYIIVDPLELEKYTNILTNNSIEHKCFNLSDDFIKGKIDIKKDIANKINETNYYKYDFFVDDIDNWLIDNLNIDIILDRISEIGIDSLKDIEKEFLKNYKYE
jgi:aromatic ring-opening dioxygenase LigB subunit